MLTSIGPIFGLFIGGRLLQVYEDFDRVDLSTLDFFEISKKILLPFSSVPMKNSRDPRWVGAWWVGFLCCAIASGFISIPIMVRNFVDSWKIFFKNFSYLPGNCLRQRNID